MQLSAGVRGSVSNFRMRWKTWPQGSFSPYVHARVEIAARTVRKKIALPPRFGFAGNLLVLEPLPTMLQYRCIG